MKTRRDGSDVDDNDKGGGKKSVSWPCTRVSMTTRFRYSLPSLSKTDAVV